LIAPITAPRVRCGRLAPIVVAIVGLAVPAGAAASGYGSIGSRWLLERSAVRELSTSCAGQNAEVRQAVDAGLNYVYAVWRGCRGIGFARSMDGGHSFGAPVQVPGSASVGVDDPAVTVARDGTVYVSYMRHTPVRNYPMVVASFDHGVTFPQLTQLLPPHAGNWGDADAIAVSPDGTVYVTWDYGPSRASVHFVCTTGGSCSFTAGDFNVVIQRSTDRGRTFGPMSHVSRGFPASGADSGPLVIDAGGRIDILYQGYRVDRAAADKLGPATSYFTASSDGGRSWSRPTAVDPQAGTMSDAEWWTDGAIALDARGNLYTTWDTQAGSAGAASDTSWLAYSTDHGRTWSSAIRVGARRRGVPHITEVAGGEGGIAYAAWMTDCCGRGYATYVRVFSIGHGWVSGATRVSSAFGNFHVYPGDNFGLSSWGDGHLALSWGSAIAPSTTAEVYATTVTASSA
jgi:hypothetical protein